MRSTEIDRRGLVRGLGLGLAAAPLVGLARAAGAGAAEPLFAGARLEADGTAAAAIFDPDGGEVARIVLPDRGHDVAVRPHTGECVVFARRPGRFAAVLDRRGGPARWFEAAPDRHFYGHGVFSPDGRLLYSTENDFAAGRGVIGVREADGYRVRGELDAGGIGPHQVALLADGRTLVVANGGIETHPDYPRAKLNLATMSPSLAYIDAASGDVLESHRLTGDARRLSIRHLAVAAGDLVVFGCQYEGPAEDLPPLVGFHRRGADPVLARGDEATLRAMANYVGSVAVDRSGEVAALSAPRGGLVAYWEVAARRPIGITQLADVCGVAALDHGFLLSSGAGSLVAASREGLVWRRFPGPAAAHRWDNHLRAVG